MAGERFALLYEAAMSAANEEINTGFERSKPSAQRP
jgi:hypothetical protein